MSIKAKFPGTCRACGGHFPAGTDIEWSKDSGSRHVKCPSTVVKSKAPLNSPGRNALQGRGRGDEFIGEKTDIVLGYSSDHKGGQSDLGKTIRAKDGRFLTCTGVASHWVSQDEADDFDLVGPHGGFERHWSLLMYYRAATAEEQAECERQIRIKESAKRFEALCNYATGYSFEVAPVLSSTDAKALGDRVKIWVKSVGYSLHEGWRVEAGLLTHHPVYDDSPYYQLIPYAVMTPEDAEIVRSAPEIK